MLGWEQERKTVDKYIIYQGCYNIYIYIKIQGKALDSVDKEDREGLFDKRIFE